MPLPGEEEDPDQKYSRCFGLEVRWRREEVLCMTQEHLGKKAKINRLSVLKIEGGQMSPTAYMQSRLARGLEVTVVELCAGAERRSREP